MFFFFKKSKIIVDCFTYQEHVLELSPIEKANKFIPEWFKHTPRETSSPNVLTPNVTIKECRGVIDTYDQGYIIPLWSDFAMEVKDKRYSWTYSDSISTAHPHPHTQWDTFTDHHNVGHIKLATPWLIHTKKDIMWSCIDPFWNNRLQTEYITIPGVINFKYQHAISINLFFSLQDKLIRIKHGHPMYHLIPLTEYKTELRYHVVSHHEFKEKNNVQFSFYNQYIKRKNIIKNKEKQCPFHWKK